eukprot:644474-Hanusia_phi.AAC.1
MKFVHSFPVRQNVSPSGSAGCSETGNANLGQSEAVRGSEGKPRMNSAAHRNHGDIAVAMSQHILER